MVISCFGLFGGLGLECKVVSYGKRECGKNKVWVCFVKENCIDSYRVKRSSEKQKKKKKKMNKRKCKVKMHSEKKIKRKE